MKMTRFLKAAIAAIMLMSILAPPALAKEMTKEIAAESVKKLLKDYPFELISLKKAPVDGLWEIGLVLENRYRIMYIDDNGSKAILPGPETQGHLIDLERTASLTNESMMELGRIDFKTLPLKDAIVLGSAKAKHKVAVFDDPY